MQNHLVSIHFQAQQSEQTITAGAQRAVKGATCNIWVSGRQTNFPNLPQAKKSWTPSLPLFPFVPSFASLVSDTICEASTETPSFWEDKKFFGKRGFCLFQEHGTLTKMAKMTNLHVVHKVKGFAPQTPEND